MPETYPGTVWHQTLLRHVVEHYRDDPRVVAVCLFGSLARGNWDQYSDLDLDVVVADGLAIDINAELKGLCAAFEPLGETALIVLADGDAGDIVLESLAELSIRYHPLASTSPNIVDSLMCLTGHAHLGAIQAAGRVNFKPPSTVDGSNIDRVLRWGLEVTIAVRRRKGWQAVRLAQLMVETLAEIYAASRGEMRTWHALDAAAAGDPLILKLGGLLPQYHPDSVRKSLAGILDLLESDLDGLSNGRLQLTEMQKRVIAKIRAIRAEA